MNVVGISAAKSQLGIVKDEKGLSSTTNKKYEAHKDIQLYDEAPTAEMSLDQFEIYALKRLKVCFNRICHCELNLMFTSNVICRAQEKRYLFFYFYYFVTVSRSHTLQLD